MTDAIQRHPGGKANYQPADLSTAFGIATVIRSVYRDYRRGIIDGVMAGKSTYILRELNQVQVVRELQERLVCLEDGRTYIPPERRLPDKQPALIEGESSPVEAEQEH